MSGHGPLVRPARRNTLALIAKVLRNNNKSYSLLFDTILSIINNTLFANDSYDKAWQEIESVMEITGNGTNIASIDYFMKSLNYACTSLERYEEEDLLQQQGQQQQVSEPQQKQPLQQQHKPQQHLQLNHQQQQRQQPPCVQHVQQHHDQQQQEQNVQQQAKKQQQPQVHQQAKKQQQPQVHQPPEVHPQTIKQEKKQRQPQVHQPPEVHPQTIKQEKKQRQPQVHQPPEVHPQTIHPQQHPGQQPRPAYIAAIKRGEQGTEPLSTDLEAKFERLVRQDCLNPMNWPTLTFHLEKPLVEHERYMSNPIMAFYPANSGSLHARHAHSKRGKIGQHIMGCGVSPGQHASLGKWWQSGKLYARLKDGNIAAAADDVIAKGMKLPSDIPISTYITLAKEMCLRMERDVSQGLTGKSWASWFDGGYFRTTGKRKRCEAADEGGTAASALGSDCSMDM
ncbi:unnamed protein product [Ectocarpus sp. 6 AP-2014]